MDMSIRMEETTVFEDTYGNVADGRPTSISRTFETLTDQGMLIEAMGQEMAIEQTMELSESLTYSVSAE